MKDKDTLINKRHEHLTSAFKQLAESLQQLADRLNDLSATMGAPIYKRFGMPFGPSDEARKIWIRHRQFTTHN